MARDLALHGIVHLAAISPGLGDIMVDHKLAAWLVDPIDFWILFASYFWELLTLAHLVDRPISRDNIFRNA